MATESPGPAPGRPRPLLLIGLGVVLALFLIAQFWPTAAPPAPATVRRVEPPAPEGRGGPIDPRDLHVRLGVLREQRPAPATADRDPFRFQPKAPPPPPPQAERAPVMKRPQQVEVDPGPPPPPPPPVIPPIPLKFMGTVEGPFGKLAAFTDCKRTFSGKEGDIVDGRYQLMKIGVESVVMQYADGRGTPQTIRQTGQDCVGK